MRLLSRFLRVFFYHFYHGFAWTYDSVAAIVSIGRWNSWIACVLPYIEGRRVLEIGHGPGHLQASLQATSGRLVAGLDESPQMIRLAQGRIRQVGSGGCNLTRGVAQALPFPARTFDTIVSTFPAEYIFENATLSEVRRALAPGGRFVVLPAAWIVGSKLIDRGAAWLFRATNQAPRFPPRLMSDRLRGLFEGAGFEPEFNVVQIRASEVLIIVAVPAQPQSQ